jgi:hypothetical protein
MFNSPSAPIKKIYDPNPDHHLASDGPGNRAGCLPAQFEADALYEAFGVSHFGQQHARPGSMPASFKII